MTLLLLCLLCTPPDALPDALPDSLPDASGKPAPAAALPAPIPAVLPVPVTGAEAASSVTPPAPPARLALWTTENKWCLACVPAHKLLDELHAEGWPCEWVEFDEHRETAEKLGIRAIPTWVVTRAGKEVSRLSGVPSKARLIEWLKQTGAVPRARNWSVDKQAANPNQSAAGDPPSAGLLSTTTQPAQGCAGGTCPTFRWRGR
jgi:thiol-disulfide isomerase/thioredoxin